jgi:UDP-glucose 4-epimerase
MTVRTLITGGLGFIGSHLAEKLISQGEKIVILDNSSTGRTTNILLNPNLEVVAGSILDNNLVDRLMAEVSTCYHLAASVGVKNIVDNPLNSLEVNIKGSEIVLRVAAKYGVRTLLASSSEIYGRNLNQPLNEESDRVLGSPKISRWSYSEAKALDELYAFQLHKTQGLPITIARLFNTVGKRQIGNYGMVLPRFVKAALSNQPLYVYGDGTQSRTFLSVSDAVEALVLLNSKQFTAGEVYNVGGNQLISVKDLAEKVISLLGSNSRIEFKSYKDVYGEDFEEPKIRYPDISKIKSAINWTPRKSLDDIIIELSDSTE